MRQIITDDCLWTDEDTERAAANISSAGEISIDELIRRVGILQQDFNRAVCTLMTYDMWRAGLTELNVDDNDEIQLRLTEAGKAWGASRNNQ